METVVIPAACRMCREVYCVEVDAVGYDQWKAGELIQNALPTLSPEERELLISKTCDSCWNKLFPEDFDEQGLTPVRDLLKSQHNNNTPFEDFQMNSYDEIQCEELNQIDAYDHLMWIEAMEALHREEDKTDLHWERVRDDVNNEYYSNQPMPW